MLVNKVYVLGVKRTLCEIAYIKMDKYLLFLMYLLLIWIGLAA